MLKAALAARIRETDIELDFLWPGFGPHVLEHFLLIVDQNKGNVFGGPDLLWLRGASQSPLREPPPKAWLLVLNVTMGDGLRAIKRSNIVLRDL